VSPEEIEPHEDKRPFFGDARDTAHHSTFRTPLWYYMLKEAELAATGRFGDPDKGFLGPVGSRLVAEVVVGGIYYNADGTGG
jgi:hypothetical protein